MSTLLRVLIVEDSEDDALLMLRELRRGGYDPHYERVETAGAMRVALAGGAWDIILSDYSMPGFSAPEALTLLAESGLDLPFIIVSGTIGEDTAVAALKTGANDFLIKGNLARLCPAIERELREAEGRREHRRAEANYKRLVEQLPAVTYVSALDQTGTKTFISPQIEAMLGFSPSEWIADARLWIHQLHPQDRERVLDQYARTRADAAPFNIEYRMVARDGREVWVRDDARVVRDDLGRPAFLHGLLFDITEGKRAEEVLQEREQRLSSIYDTVADVIFHLAVEKGGQYRYISVNQAFLSVTGLGYEQVVGKLVDEVIREPSLTRVLEKYTQAIREQSIVRWEETSDYPAGRLTGEVSVAPVFDEARNCTHLVGAVHDITERKQAEKQIQHQLERLSALRQIDEAISGSLDLSVTLNIVLEQVTLQLRVDAADVLLLNSHFQVLEYAAGRGFRSRAIERSRIRLGEGHAGRAALERVLVGQPNLNVEDARRPNVGLEDFHAYYAVPLLVKGQVKGVLEVFHRAPLKPDRDWLNFLETLAGQVAIAIENALLFNDLQRSNSKLTMAYDTTLEGWSRALDLRDRETEGHSRRVTEMTVRLARAMGIRDEELAHIRRGALLHDIGKVAIPDHVLLKPGPLGEEEWVIMRQHPLYAYQLLSPIEYLRPALDIPYCHHEKWDGTGYPRGLKGEEIPQAARLFAVVDVWDALRSDRPYRPAWLNEKVLEHIRSLHGTHFDPRVVDAFLTIIIQEPSLMQPPRAT